MRICIMGSGSWGMALAIQLQKNAHDVTIWTHTAASRQQLAQTRCNEKLLPGIQLPDEIFITCDIAETEKADMVLLAVPSFAVAETAEKLSNHLRPGAVVVNVGKGLDAAHGFCRFSQTISQVLCKKNDVVVLTGPTHAEEVARNIPTTIVAASKSQTAAELVQESFMNDSFRVYTSSDVIGAELGGAFKNIIALGAGIADGMGLGDNSKAALMTRGLTEIARLGVALGARQNTFAGLTGMGDLIVTCTSMHSRNRRAGMLIGQGVAVKEAMQQIGAVVEGYYATEAGYFLAQSAKVSMPITEMMYQVLYKGASASDAILQLMTRAKKHESEEVWLS